MAREGVASTGIRAASIQGMAGAFERPTYRRIVNAEPWLRRLIPLLVVIFIGVLATFATLQTISSRNETLAQASRQLATVNALVKSEINRILDKAKQGGSNPFLILQNAIPDDISLSGQNFVLTNDTGFIVARWPESNVLKGQLPDISGGAITIPGGQKVIIQGVKMPEPFGQLVVFQSQDAVLADWRQRTTAFVVTLAIASLVVLALAMAYFWQAWRARRTDAVFAKVRDRLDTALHRGRCGLWDWDIARGTIYWSDSMYHMLGYERQNDVLSFGEVNSLVHPDDGNLFRLADQLAGDKIATVDQAFRIRAADGSWVWVRTRAELIQDEESKSPHLIGITVDITEQRRADAANATADLRLRDAIETIGEAFVLWDADNKLVLCNSKFQDLHNLPPEAVIRGTPYAVLKNYLSEHLVHARAQEDDTVQSYETRLPNGRWLQINERPTRDGGYVSVGTDITTLKNQEELYIESERKLTAMVSDLRRSRLTLEEQTKQLTTLVERYLEQKAEAESANLAKSEFLARMSHELRTPLNAILGFSEMMENEIFGALGSPKYVDYCRDISRSGKSLLSIIADILDMSQIEAGRIRIDKRPLILNDVVETSVSQIKNEADAKNIRISTDLTADSNLVADKRSIARILSHLLHNAVKYTPEGGKITVRTREVSGAINLFVEDTGRGIAKEILPNIGKPFAWVGLDPTKPADGSGLGLALAKSFAELHGGSLAVRSTEGTGTTVLVRLPIREGPIEVAA